MKHESELKHEYEMAICHKKKHNVAKNAPIIR